MLHVSNAAGKSLWTIICSAAVSNMLNTEEVSGGLQSLAGGRLAEQLLMSTSQT